MMSVWQHHKHLSNQIDTFCQSDITYTFRCYTGVVNPKPTIGKPRNGQRNVHYCRRGTKTENEKNIK